MATTKKRLNITLSDDLDAMLGVLAKREHAPRATVAAGLLRRIIEIEEDTIWAKYADERSGNSSKWLSHKDVWA